MTETKSDNGGIAIRLERMWRGLTSADLAERASISPAYLSRIENGKANPSLEVISRIAEALGLSREALLADGDRARGEKERNMNSRLKPTLVKKSERKTMRHPHSSAVYELLTPDLQRNLQFIMVCHQPGERTEVYSHAGEESLLCLTGSVKISAGGEEFVLEPGDCISFDSAIPHSVTAVGIDTATLVSAQTPPSF